MQLSKAAEILNTSHQGKDVFFCGCSTDTRTIKKGELFIALKGENFDGHDYVEKAISSGAAAVLTEKDSDLNEASILVDDTKLAMGQLAKSWRANFSIPVVAVTGSNGKTTVKEMLASIFRCNAHVLATKGNLNNEIGVPLTLFGLSEEHQFAVIEMGANHSGEIEMLSGITQPTVAVITQCAPAHLEGFGSVEGVAHAKAEIFDGLVDEGVAVINGDDDFADLWMQKSQYKNQLTFGLGSDNEVTADSISSNDGRSSFLMRTPVGDVEINLNLPGSHNVMNALAAAACAISAGTALSTIKQGLESMESVKGRLQIKAGINQSRIIDDTYNANPRSLDAALKVLIDFPGRHWLVLGDMGELGDDAEQLHQEAGEKSKACGVERIYALGELTNHSVSSFGEGAYHAEDHQQLISLLQEEVSEDVTVLIKGSRAMQMEKLVHGLEAND